MVHGKKGVRTKRTLKTHDRTWEEQKEKLGRGVRTIGESQQKYLFDEISDARRSDPDLSLRTWGHEVAEKIDLQKTTLQASTREWLVGQSRPNLFRAKPEHVLATT